MTLTNKVAEQIAARYGRLALNCHGGHAPLEAALAEVIRRQGGLFAVLTEDARRDLILTLGDNRRARNDFSARRRSASVPALALARAAE
jgi:hypothetical protein